MSLTQSEQALLAYLRLDGDDNAEIVAQEPGAGSVSWDQLCNAALRHGVGPLLYAELKERGADGVSAPLLHSLRGQYFASLARNVLTYHELGAILELFRSESLQAILLKGAALAGTVYPDIALRPMSDVDPLVRVREVPRAKEILTACGYVPYLALAEGFNESFGQAATFTKPIPYPVGIDLRWHVLGWSYYRKDVPSMDWFWDNALEQRVAGIPALVLSPEGRILHLSAHLAFHHRWQRLNWFYDIAQVIRCYENQLDWDTVIAKAGEFEILRALQVTLDKTVALLAPPPAPEVLERLESPRVGLTEKVVFAFMTAREKHAAILLSAISRDNVLRKARFLATVAFPSREYMAERFQLSSRRKLPLYYAYRLGRGLCRVLRSLLSVLSVLSQALKRPRR
ncbi:MAG: nucleotidyltransferase family protein [Anaerolineae bacterium]